MADNQVGGFVVAFITIIIGVVLLTSITDTVWDTANTYTIENESIEIGGTRNASGQFDGATTISLGNDNIASIIDVFLVNSSDELTLTETTDYVVNTSVGTVVILDTATTRAFTNLSENMVEQAGNLSVWNYTHGDNYVDDGVSRTLLNLIPLFFVIGLVIFVLAFVWIRYLKDLVDI